MYYSVVMAFCNLFISVIFNLCNVKPCEPMKRNLITVTSMTSLFIIYSIIRMYMYTLSEAVTCIYKYTVKYLPVGICMIWSRELWNVTVLNVTVFYQWNMKIMWEKRSREKSIISIWRRREKREREKMADMETAEAAGTWQHQYQREVAVNDHMWLQYQM